MKSGEMAKLETKNNASNEGVLTLSPALNFLFVFITIIFVSLFLLIPLATILFYAFQGGIKLWYACITESDALSALKLTLIVAAIAVPINSIFGIAAAWAISHFDFRGKNFLVTLIDLPFATSPVISGFVFILLFGIHSPLGNWLESLGIKVIFALPGMVLATCFVTVPFVARELIPLMMQQGHDDELAALTLGAGPFQTFFRITLPKIKWALLYGIILLNARAMGEFGAVSVVSGHIRGQSITLPLHTEILYNEYNFTASFAVASLLTFLAIVTLILKNLIRDQREKRWE